MQKNIIISIYRAYSFSQMISLITFVIMVVIFVTTIYLPPSTRKNNLNNQKTFNQGDSPKGKAHALLVEYKTK